MTYGTGAIMAVPAHDERDFTFARKYGLEVRVVIQPEGMVDLNGASMPEAIPAYGCMVNSGALTGTPGDRAFQKTVEYLEERGTGHYTVNYRLRDWLISRQRYWGAPIPIVYCEKCGPQAIPDEQLPVLLPEDIEWRPTGESPLKLHPTWKLTVCPQCEGPAERDTDTMDTFMCSSWYHLGYLSPWYPEGPFDQNEYDYWMPVDVYTGGVEHATMHLIYTRYFHKAMRDIGITKGDEPMLKLRNQGQILGPDGQRMSKSRGNVIDPDEQVRLYGADTVRAYLMFGYRWSEGGPWDPGNIQGSSRWLYRTWSAFLEPGKSGGLTSEARKALRRKVHQTLRQVTRDYERFEFNTIISALMELMNELVRFKGQGAWETPEWKEAVNIYVRMMAPVTPHIAEELWAQLGQTYSVHTQEWPKVDEVAAAEEEITLVVQVNGKVRDRITVPVDISREDAQAAALASDAVQRHLEGKQPRQVIVVPKKLVNIVL
jgi:leucyl-tRNA synthetase